MSILKIYQDSNPCLKKRNAPVVQFNAKLWKLLDDMKETLIELDALGIAAPQVGINQQIFIALDEKTNEIYEVINPKFEFSDKKIDDLEGCLSVPDVYGYVLRFDKIIVKAQDRFGKSYTINATGMFSRVLQHEYDHLKGVLFTEIMSKKISLEELNLLSAKNKRIVFMGTPEFAVPILQKLVDDGMNVVAVVTQPDRLVGRKRLLTSPPVKVLAKKLGISVLQPEKISDHKALDELYSYAPDLVITAAFGQILPKELLLYPEYGCINIHASLLPKYRGGAPVQYAIMNGDAITGITIMDMAEKLDAGDILVQQEVEITDLDDTGSLLEKLSECGAKLLSSILPKIFNKEITRTCQNENEVTFSPTIKREQERLDWTFSADKIYNHIRALHPSPGAYTTFLDQNVKIWKSEKQDMLTNKLPGEIIELHLDGFVVACGKNSALKITDLQIAGKKRTPLSEILRNNHIFQLGKSFK